MALTNHILGSVFDPTSLRAYYKLEDVNDSSGNGYNLTNNGGVTFLDSGRFSKCAYYELSGQLYRDTNLGIDGGIITISAWASFTKNPESGAAEYIIWMGSSLSKIVVTMGYGVDPSTGLNTSFFRRYGSPVNEALYAYTLLLNNWYHFVGTYDGTYIRLYINGILVAGPVASSGVDGTFSDFCYIGYQTTQFKYDEVLVFSRCWSAQEVYNYYQQYASAMTNGMDF